MQKIFTLFFIAFGTFFLVPSLAFAVDAGGASGDGSSMHPPAPTPMGASSMGGGAEHPDMPPKPPLLIRESPTMPSLPPHQPMLLRESPSKASDGQLRESPSKPSMGMHDTKGPRDASSGQSSGRLNGLPPGEPFMGKHGSTTPPRPMGVPKDMREGGASSTERDNMREKMDERRDGMKQKQDEHRGEMLKRMAHQMIERMQAAVDRLKKLSDRINSRILKQKGAGVDTSTTEAVLVIARGKITDAQAAIDLAKGAIDSAAQNADATASSTTSSNAGKPVREALSKAKDAVFAAHKALVDAINGMEGDKGPHGENASSTPHAPEGAQ